MTKLILLLALLLSVSSADTEVAVGERNIYEIASNTADFSMIVAAIDAAGLKDALTGDGPLTVFAPTDKAVEELPDGVLDFLLLPENKDTLAAVIKYHVVAANATSSSLASGPVVTLNGDSVDVETNGTGIQIDNANVIDPFDVVASNGIIHTIDSVLVPSDVDLSAATDAQATENLSDEPEPTGDEAAVEERNIYDIASNTADFSILMTAIVAAGLDGALTGEGPLTVFAPTNKAFEELPDGVVDFLLRPENKDTLTALLTYHVVAAKVPSSSIVSGPVVTLNGDSVDVETDGTGIQIDNANVIDPFDVMASNGIIHTIDSVLVPSNVDLAAAEGFAKLLIDNPCSGVMCDGDGDGPCHCDPCKQCPYVPQDPVSIYELVNSIEDFSTLGAAIDAAGLDEALSGDGPFTVFAPTNNAFAKLPPQLLDFLLVPANKETLSDILKYHVVAGNVTSTSIQSGPVETLNGKSVNVQAFSTGIRVDNANVIAPIDVAATNGVVHTIDSVLIPPNLELPSYTNSPTVTPVTPAPTKKPTPPAPTPEESSIEDTENTATIKSSLVKISLVLCFLGMFVV